MASIPAPVKELLLVGALSRAVGVSETTIRRLANRGVLKCLRDSANNRVFQPEAVERARKHYAKQRHG
jgi:DNA-binding transcriptional MerR regulator